MDIFRDYFLLQKRPDLTIALSTSIEKLEKAAEWIKSDCSFPVISLNKELGKNLLGVQPSNYSTEIVDWIISTVREIPEDTIIITGIELIFEPGFQLDPLAIFRQASRNKALLVLWPGEFKNNNISYAVPEHAHYRYWNNPGVEIIHL